jgi:hypothetical protein
VGPPLQQPLGHEVASHKQWPLVVSHVRPVPQAAHATPPAPHEVSFSLASASQVPLLQQPVHATPPQVHEPMEHDAPLVHAAHVAPALPQEVPLCAANGSHEPVGPPEQQPFAHDVASQMHAPALHSRPVPHAAHATPPLPHCPLLCDVPSRHCPLEQQPLGHVVELHVPCWSPCTSAGASPPDSRVPSCPPSPTVVPSGPVSPAA